MPANRRALLVRRRLLRVDIALGVVLALLVVLLAPGIAIAAVIAVALLVVCAISLALQRRQARRGSGSGTLGPSSSSTTRSGVTT